MKLETIEKEQQGLVYASELELTSATTDTQTGGIDLKDKRGWRRKAKLPSISFIRKERREEEPKTFSLRASQRFSISRAKLAEILSGSSPDGQGVFSSVAEGFDTKFNRPVMFKIPRSGLITDRLTSESINLLYKEVRELGNLNHPNILEVYDLVTFKLEDGTLIPAMVMERAEGDITSKFSSETLMSIDSPSLYSSVSDMTLQVADALDYIHNKGLVHRDLKPENILYSVGADQTDRYILADLGLVQGSYRKDETPAQMNAAPTFYAAPEQVVSLTRDIAGRTIQPELHAKHTPKSDQYALAMCAYKMLSGEETFKPFLSPDGKAFAFQTTHEYLLKDYGIPNQIYNVFLKATSYNPDERFSSCKEFARELAAAITETNYMIAA